MKVESSGGLVGDPVAISVTGLQPGRRIVIESEMTDALGIVWSARGVFHADARGAVNTYSSPSASGTYQGVASDGLLWSMLPIAASALDSWGPDNAYDLQTPREPALDLDTPQIIKLRAYTASHPLLPSEELGETIYRQWLKSPDVIRTPVREGRIRGLVFEPKQAGNLPAVIVVGGSSGGVMENYAALLASHGIRVFALGWFGYEDLPQEGAHIPLEYFSEAIIWFKRYTKESKIGLAGVSYGGMTVLMVASTFPELIGAVFAGVPSHVHNLGVKQDGSRSATFSFNGEDLPFVDPYDAFPQGSREIEEMMSQATARMPLRVSDIFLRGWNAADMPEGAVIEVEKIKAPLFITGAEDDGQWYSAVAGDRIVERLQRYDFEYSVRYERIDSAGHFIDYPHPVMNELSLSGFHPHAGIWISNGGSASVMARAQREIFPETVAFFQEALNKKKSSEE